MNFLVDARGKIYRAGFHVWKPLNLTTLHPMAWPPLQMPTILASGLVDSSLGLSDGEVWWALCQLLAQPMLIHPRVAHDLLNGITWTYADSLRMTCAE